MVTFQNEGAPKRSRFGVFCLSRPNRLRSRLPDAIEGGQFRYRAVSQLEVDSNWGTWLGERKDDAGRTRPVVLKHTGEGNRTRAGADALWLEALLAQRLAGPQVTPLIDFGVLEGRPFTVFEYDGGVFLVQVLEALRAQQRALPAGVAVGIAVQVGELVARLHGLSLIEEEPGGWVHGALCPRNLVLTERGDVRVSGLIGVRAMGRIVGEEHVPAAALPYAAPELLAGEPVGASVDIHALGSVLLDMLGPVAPGESELAGLVRSTLSIGPTGGVLTMSGFLAALKELLQRTSEDSGRAAIGAQVSAVCGEFLEERRRFVEEQLATEWPEEAEALQGRVQHWSSSPAPGLEWGGGEAEEVLVGESGGEQSVMGRALAGVTSGGESAGDWMAESGTAGHGAAGHETTVGAEMTRRPEEGVEAAVHAAEAQVDLAHYSDEAADDAVTEIYQGTAEEHAAEVAAAAAAVAGPPPVPEAAFSEASEGGAGGEGQAALWMEPDSASVAAAVGRGGSRWRGLAVLGAALAVALVVATYVLRSGPGEGEPKASSGPSEDSGQLAEVTEAVEALAGDRAAEEAVEARARDRAAEEGAGAARVAASPDAEGAAEQPQPERAEAEESGESGESGAAEELAGAAERDRAEVVEAPKSGDATERRPRGQRGRAVRAKRAPARAARPRTRRVRAREDEEELVLGGPAVVPSAGPTGDIGPGIVIEEGPGRVAFLSVDSSPYATLYIDGRKEGVTPMLGYEIEPGPHRLVAKTEDGRLRRLSLLLEPGKTEKIKLTWDDEEEEEE